MLLWTRLALKQQFERVTASHWLPYFQTAALDYGIPVHVLLGVASRETNCRNIIGDGGHGHGIMQIDDRSYPAWCNRGIWKDVGESIRMGAYVLAEKRRQISPSIPVEDRLKVALAAYNAGTRHIIHDYFSGVVDRHTTGQDYSKDVLKRAEVFKELLGG